jgi:hypothetical protein
MQALFFASSGTRPRTSDEKVAVMHQQVSDGVPVALEISWAHWLGSPQMGHFEGSISLSIGHYFLTGFVQKTTAGIEMKNG